MRFWRIENMDDYTAELPPVRNTELIELVDKLPRLERYVIERNFFGGAPISEVARELDISQDRAKKIRERALEILRGKLQ